MIVIPMAGRSSRFYNAGYTIPKFRLPIDGATVFDCVMQSFSIYFSSMPFRFICRDDLETIGFVECSAKSLGINDFSVARLPHETAGQAETVYLGTTDVPDDEELIIFNIDTFRPGFRMPDWSSACDGFLEVFTGTGDNWSYVQLGPDNTVIKTTEKQPISNLCSDGLYYFRSKRLFSEAFVNTLAKRAKTQGEYYVAPLYNHLISQGKIVRHLLIDKADVVFCGTPSEYESLRGEQQ